MGSRKRIVAEEAKKIKKDISMARLANNPTSPRKARLIADLIRGMNVEKAISVLKFSSKESATKIHKLLISAISNWQLKNEGVRIEDSNLYIKEIQIDGGRMLKRLRPAPQGRGYRVRKRSNHITLIVESKN